MKFYPFILTILLYFLFSGCQKDLEVPEKDYPLVELIDISEIDSAGVTINAKITNKGNSEITEYGVIVSLDPNRTLDDIKAFDSIALQGNTFSFRIESDLEASATYYVRAYLKNATYTSLSNIKKFVSKGCLPPEISQIYPDFGSPGKIINIIGKHFNSDPKKLIVKFDTTSARIIKANSDTITILCPNFPETKSIDITVKVLKQSVKFPQSFNYMYPWTEISKFPGNMVYYSSGFVLGNYGYVTWGSAGPEIVPSTQLWRLNLDSYQWDTAAPIMARKRLESIDFSIGNIGYMGLGYTYVDPYIEVNKDLWKYDPDINSWKKCADFEGSLGFYRPPSFVINEKLYLYTNKVSTTIIEYDPKLDKWTSMPGNSLIASKWIGDAFSILNKGYFLETYSSNWNENKAVIWEYSPENNLISVYDTIKYPDHWNGGVKNFVIKNHLYLCDSRGNITMYDFENKLSFDLANYENFDQMPNFIFCTENKAIYHDGSSGRVFEFYPK